MNAFFAKFEAVSAVLTQAGRLVSLFEQLLPIPKAGKQKLDLVLQVVQAGAAVEPAIRDAVSPEEITSIVTGFVGVLVRNANTAGAFKSSGASN